MKRVVDILFKVLQCSPFHIDSEPNFDGFFSHVTLCRTATLCLNLLSIFLCSGWFFLKYWVLIFNLQCLYLHYVLFYKLPLAGPWGNALHFFLNKQNKLWHLPFWTSQLIGNHLVKAFKQISGMHRGRAHMLKSRSWFLPKGILRFCFPSDGGTRTGSRTGRMGKKMYLVAQGFELVSCRNVDPASSGALLDWHSSHVGVTCQANWIA